MTPSVTLGNFQAKNVLQKGSGNGFPAAPPLINNLRCLYPARPMWPKIALEAIILPRERLQVGGFITPLAGTGLR
jgi:hypothetical protein